MKGPDGKYFFGLVKIGDKGQIVIPKEAREVFGLAPGDQLLLLGDIKQGLALVDPAALKLFEMIPGVMSGVTAGVTSGGMFPGSASNSDGTPPSETLHPAGEADKTPGEKEGTSHA